LDLLQQLGQPQFKYASLHVAGSKGKGSVAHFLALGLREAGFRVGSYSSPHLCDWRERIQVQLQYASDFRYAAALERVLAVAKGEQTFFDLLTAAAFDVFAAEKCDVAVVEVGLGGRYDSTRALDPVASIVTSIEMEHADVLGPDLQSIAWNKAGIFSENSQAWIGDGIPSAALQVLEAEAKKLNLQCQTATPSGRVEIAHPQAHMLQNFDLAHSILAANADRWPGAAGALLRLPSEKLSMPGRWEFRQLTDGRIAVFDVAHSQNSIAAVVQAFRQQFPEQQRGVVIALRDDKNGSELATELGQQIGPQPENEKWWAAPAGDHPRSANPQELASAWNAAGWQVQAISEVAFPEAADVLLITGSTYLVGALRNQTTAVIPAE
jgi:dihydrofolate synthase/folylpolyglutamate synthase